MIIELIIEVIELPITLYIAHKQYAPAYHKIAIFGLILTHTTS